MTEEDNDTIKQFYDAHCCYSMQTRPMEGVQRQPAREGWAWEPADANNIKPPSDFRFGPSEVKQPAGQPRSNPSPGK